MEIKFFDFSTKNTEKKQEIKTFEEFLIAIDFKFLPYLKQVEMVEFCFKRDDRIKMVLARRGIGKTELVAIAGVLWHLYNHPTDTIAIISSTQSLSRAILQSISAYMLSSGLFNVKMAKADTIKLVENKFSKEPSVSAKSLKTILRAIHPTFVLFDDPLTMETADSKVMRALAFKKYEEAIDLTKNVIIIGQPSHEEDLYQLLRNKPLDQVDKLEVWNDDLPEMKVDLNKMRQMGKSERNIQANYEGNLILDEDYPFAQFKPVEFVGFRPSILFIDPAFGGKDDIGLSFLDEYDGKLYCYAKAVRGSILSDSSLDKIFDIVNTIDSEDLEIFMESNDNGGAYSFLLQYAEKNGIMYPIYKKRQFANKETRIRDLIVSKMNVLKFINDSDMTAIWRFNPSLRNQRDDVPDAVASSIYVYDNYYEVVRANF